MVQWVKHGAVAILIVVALAALAAWIAKSAFIRPYSPHAAAATAPLRQAKNPSAHDIAHPAAVVVPIASLQSLDATSGSPAPQAELSIGGGLLSQDAGQGDGAAEPVRSVAPVSSVRDEGGQTVQVPVAAVPGAPARHGKASAGQRVDTGTEKDKPRP